MLVLLQPGELVRGDFRLEHSVHCPLRGSQHGQVLVSLLRPGSAGQRRAAPGRQRRRGVSGGPCELQRRAQLLQRGTERRTLARRRGQRAGGLRRHAQQRTGAAAQRGTEA